MDLEMNSNEVLLTSDSDSVNTIASPEFNLLFETNDGDKEVTEAGEQRKKHSNKKNGNEEPVTETKQQSELPKKGKMSKTENEEVNEAPKDVMEPSNASMTVRYFDSRKELKKKKGEEALVICYNCGDAGHNGSCCPNNPCPVCFQLGHKGYECTQQKDTTKTGMVCVRCGQHSHNVTQCCEDLNRNYRRIYSMQCYCCGRYGHANCKNENTKKIKVRMCSNCGQTDSHCAYTCTSYPISHEVVAMGLQTSPNDPELCCHCLYPDHVPTKCPLMQRHTNNPKKFKFHQTQNPPKKFKQQSKIYQQ
ncbi:hypothetical protein RFI_26829 [Reticulomyxa filosa]|uniref:CCHC-type domain-containing protein n=1 Tax=Reticulomyxa filosa TaxID=46433 RepID=X6M968_RETFI|nr:hypothetical protein RFI_26829 [Reticulomyxa filosa]|eukprot:ETO10548.1 hypothetical protein RFI_26829 [Reticulomyxa filosa]